MELDGQTVLQAVVRDITERKRVEEKLLETNEQLERAPLEQAMRATRPEDREIMVGDFMWMGAVDLIDGRRLHLYKHTDTRRYLRLDAEGHAYALAADDYQIHDMPSDATDDLRVQRPLTIRRSISCL